MRIITAYGIPGYGPDASNDNYGIHSTWPDVADEVRRMLGESADALGDDAEVSAEHGDYESAWKARKQADAMYLLSDSLNNRRAGAPVFRDDPAAWPAQIERIIGENFPYDVDSGCRIYVWESDEFGLDECPCCKRMTDLADVLCGECEDAGDRIQEHATPDQPYPYCAATDSSPLAGPDGAMDACGTCGAPAVIASDGTVTHHDVSRDNDHAATLAGSHNGHVSCTAEGCVTR